MSYFYYSNGNSTFINIKDMVYNGNSTFTNTDGFPSFPGNKYTLGNDDRALNNSGFFFKNVDIITNRMTNYVDYNLTTTSITIPTNANYLTSILIGAGGGGGGGGPSARNNTNNGGGGGCGGLYNIYMLSKIPLNDTTSNGIGIVSTYNITIGTGGNGGNGNSNANNVNLLPYSKGNSGNSGNSTSIELITNANSINATVNGGTGGSGGNRSYISAIYPSVNNGIDCTLSFSNNSTNGLSNYLSNNISTNTLISKNNTYVGNISPTPPNVPIPAYAVTSSELSISNHITNINSTNFDYTFYNSSLSYSSGGLGASGGLVPNTITAGSGLPGPPGFVRIYYFYN